MTDDSRERRTDGRTDRRTDGAKLESPKAACKKVNKVQMSADRKHH